MSITTPYDAVMRAAGLSDRADRGLAAVSGLDRASFLQGLLSNDVLALRPGAGCYATYLTPQGRMIADMAVLACTGRILVDLLASALEPVCDRWRRTIFSEQVRVERVREWRGLGLYGPAAGPMLSDVLEGAHAGMLAALPEYHHVAGTLDGDDVVVASSHEMGGPGFILYGPRGTIDRLAGLLVGRGAAAVSPELADLRRIEAGRPAFGIDMDEHTIPLEAGIEDRAISMTKGCYVGQEVIVRVLHRGQGRVARRLVGLVLDAEPGGVSVGDSLMADGVEVGVLTSVAVSPRFGPIALGYVRRDRAEPGTRIGVGRGGAEVPARVSPLPFGA